MYKINSEVINKQTSQKWLDPGVNSNLILTQKAEVSDKGNAFIAFTLTNEHGQYITRTEWEVNDLGPVEALPVGLQNLLAKIAAENNTSVDKAAEDFVNNKRRAQMRRIINFAKQFVSEDELEGNEFGSYIEFIKFISDMLQGKTEDIPLRAKLVYDRKGYVNTPDYVRPNTPWIERMDEVPEESSKIQIVTELDAMTRPQPNGYTPPKKENPFEDKDEVPAGAGKSEDTPF